MEEKPPVIRRGTEYGRLIQSLVLVFSILGTFTIQGQVNAGVEKTASVTEYKEIVELSAGVSRNLSNMMNELQSEDFVAGVSKQLLEFSQEPLPKVEKLEVETVTSPAENEPENVYKSLDEVKISRNMDLTKTTGLSKEDFVELLSDFPYDYAGFYERNAEEIWEQSQRYQVNEIFMSGVYGLESYYGSDKRHISCHNYGSIMTRDGKLVRYASDAEGIEANYKLFSNCYLSPDGKYYKGVTLDSIGDTYCPPTPDCPSWADKVYSCMQLFLEKN